MVFVAYMSIYRVIALGNQWCVGNPPRLFDVHRLRVPRHFGSLHYGKELLNFKLRHNIYRHLYLRLLMSLKANEPKREYALSTNHLLQNYCFLRVWHVDVKQDRNHLRIQIKKEKIRVLQEIKWKESLGLEKEPDNFGLRTSYAGFTPLAPRASHPKLKSTLKKI